MSAQVQKRLLQKGAIDLLILAMIAIVTLAVPVTAKLVQQRQETRKQAAVDSGGGGCGPCESYVSQTCGSKDWVCDQCFKTCYDTCYETCTSCTSYNYSANECEEWGTADCNPYDCNPHDCDSYECNCREEDNTYECGGCETDPNKCTTCGSGDCNSGSFNCEQDGGTCGGTKPNCSCNYPEPTPTPVGTNENPTPTPTETSPQATGCTNPAGENGEKYCSGNSLYECNPVGSGYIWELSTNCSYGCVNGVCNPLPTATPIPEPTATSAPLNHECATSDDCEGAGRCNVVCNGWPRACHWNACPAPTVTPESIAISSDCYPFTFKECQMAGCKSCSYCEDGRSVRCNDTSNWNPDYKDMPTTEGVTPVVSSPTTTQGGQPSGTTHTPAIAPSLVEKDPCILHISDTINYDNCQRALLIGKSEGNEKQYVEMDSQGNVIAVKWDIFTPVDVEAQNVQNGMAQVLKDTGVCGAFSGGDKTNCETAVALGIAEGNWQKYIGFENGSYKVAWDKLGAPKWDFKKSENNLVKQINDLQALSIQNPNLSLVLKGTEEKIIEKYRTDEAVKIITQIPVVTPVPQKNINECLFNCQEMSGSYEDCLEYCRGYYTVVECDSTSKKFNVVYYDLATRRILETKATGNSCLEGQVPITLKTDRQCDGDYVQILVNGQVSGSQPCEGGCSPVINDCVEPQRWVVNLCPVGYETIMVGGQEACVPANIVAQACVGKDTLIRNVNGEYQCLGSEFSDQLTYAPKLPLPSCNGYQLLKKVEDQYYCEDENGVKIKTQPDLGEFLRSDMLYEYGFECPTGFESIKDNGRKFCKRIGNDVLCPVDWQSMEKDGKIVCAKEFERPVSNNDLATWEKVTEYTDPVSRFGLNSQDLIPARLLDPDASFADKYLSAKNPIERALVWNYTQNFDANGAALNDLKSGSNVFDQALSSCEQSGFLAIGGICQILNGRNWSASQKAADELFVKLYAQKDEQGNPLGISADNSVWRQAKLDPFTSRLLMVKTLDYGMTASVPVGDTGSARPILEGTNWAVAAFTKTMLVGSSVVNWNDATAWTDYIEGNIELNRQGVGALDIERAKLAFFPAVDILTNVVPVGKLAKPLQPLVRKIPVTRAIDDLASNVAARLTKGVANLIPFDGKLPVEVGDTSVARIVNTAARNEKDEILRSGMLTAEEKLTLELERQQIAKKAFDDAIVARRLDPQNAAALALEERRILELNTAEFRLGAARAEVDLESVKKALTNTPDDLTLVKRAKDLQDEIDVYNSSILEAQRAENLAKANALRNLKAETAEEIAARRARDEASEQAQRESAALIAEREAVEQAAREADSLVPVVPVEPNAIQKAQVVVRDGLDSVRQGIRDVGTNLKTKVDDFVAGQRAARDAGVAARLEAEKAAQEVADKAKKEALEQTQKEAAARAEREAAELQAKKQAEIAANAQAQQVKKEAESKVLEAQKKAQEALLKEQEARLAAIEKEAVVAKQKQIGQINAEMIGSVNQDLGKVLANGISEEKLANLPEAQVKSQLEVIMGKRFDNWTKATSTGNSYYFDQVYKKLTDAGVPAGEAQDLAREMEAALIGSKNRVVSQQIDRVKITQQKVSGRVEVAIGDMHGDSQQMAELLGGGKTDAFGVKSPVKIIDPKTNEWIGGSSIVHSTGDLFDRAPSGKSSVDAARQAMLWQKEARKAGGDLSITLGNHDVNAIYQARTGKPLITPALTPDELSQLQKDTELLNWVMEQPALSKSGKTLYIHSDSLVYLEYGRNLDEINANIRKILQTGTATFTNTKGDEVTKTLVSLAGDLTNGRGELTGENVDKMLKVFDVDKIVHGHTRGVAATDSRVTNVDFGLSGGYNSAANRGKIAVTKEAQDSVVNKIELKETSPSPVKTQNGFLANLQQMLGDERGSGQLGLISGADLVNKISHIGDLLPGGKGIINVGTETLPEVKTFWRGLKDEFGRWQWPWGQNEYYKSSQLFDQPVSVKVYRPDKKVAEPFSYSADKNALLDEMPPYTVLSTDDNTFAKNTLGQWESREQFIDIWGAGLGVNRDKIESRYETLKAKNWPIPLFHGTPDASAKSILASKQHFMQSDSFTDFLGYASYYSDEDTFTALIYNLPVGEVERVKSMGGDKFFLVGGTKLPFMKETVDGKIYLDLNYDFSYPDAADLRAYLDSLDIKYRLEDGQIKVPIYRGLSSNNPINEAEAIFPRAWDDDLKVYPNYISFRDGQKIEVLDYKPPIFVP